MCGHNSHCTCVDTLAEGEEVDILDMVEVVSYDGQGSVGVGVCVAVSREMLDSSYDTL